MELNVIAFIFFVLGDVVGLILGLLVTSWAKNRTIREGEENLAEVLDANRRLSAKYEKLGATLREWQSEHYKVGQLLSEERRKLERANDALADVGDRACRSAERVDEYFRNSNGEPKVEAEESEDNFIRGEE